MTKISEALTYGLTIRESATNGSDFANAPTDYRRLFMGEDGQLHAKDDGGTVTDLGGTAGKELDYVEVTSPVTISGANQGAATTLVTGNSVTYDGAPVMIEWYCPSLGCDASNGAGIVVDLYEDATILGRIAVLISSASQDASQVGRRRRTPAAGAHTFTVKAWETADGGSAAYAGAGGTGAQVPMFLRVTKV